MADMNRIRKDIITSNNNMNDDGSLSFSPPRMPVLDHPEYYNTTNGMNKAALQTIASHRTAGKPCSNYFMRITVLFFAASLVTLVPTIVLILSPSSSIRRRSLSSIDSATIFSTTSSSTSDCEISYGTYKGNQYYSEQSGTIGKPKCLVESKFMRLQQHNVQIPGSTELFTDWLWIDYHDRINVLVQAPLSSSSSYSKLSEEEDDDVQFYIFEQTKYALEGRTSLAIIGGIVEPNEEPEQAARREALEEMKVQCENYVLLGRYRTDVNRGMGWLNSYVALNCSSRQPVVDGAGTATTATADEVGTHDVEQQNLKTISISELKKSLLSGRFLEVQWTATISLALHYLENERTIGSSATE